MNYLNQGAAIPETGTIISQYKHKKSFAKLFANLNGRGA